MSNNIRNIVLVGKAGNGKSSTGNSIVMQRGAFKEAGWFGSVTKTSQMKSTKIMDPIDHEEYTVNVIDTPGQFDGTTALTQASKEIVRCMALAKEGIHAFIAVLKISQRFSEEEAKAIDHFEKLFGTEAVDRMIIVFTRADDVESPEQWAHMLSTAPPLLQNFLGRCSNRVVLFNNKAYKLRIDEEMARLERQSSELLVLVNRVVTEKGGKAYTNEIYEQVKEEMKKHEQLLETDPRKEIVPYEALKPMMVEMESRLLSVLQIKTESRIRNIVLMGKSGNGKSSTGNSILMQGGAFKEAKSFASITKRSKRKSTKIIDPNDHQEYTVNVIDTPGQFDGTTAVTRVSEEIVRCMALAKEGIHAFIAVLKINSRFTEEEANAIDQLEKLFGTEAVDRMIVVFTGADGLESPKQWARMLSTAPPLLQNFLGRCGNRILLFNNKEYKLGDKEGEARLERQRSELLVHVNRVVTENGGEAYTNEIYEQVKEEMKKHEQLPEADPTEQDIPYETFKPLVEITQTLLVF
ncbi:hypothetical protein Tsubulata_017796 [Turnera subulata]|uniref:AIG1-type G domain-containing protein n=1 Tax=Turnera subulata TaxID=218843 RepID=A0A9Q0FXN0_9ROSI|nr:hypothetical protein Tsubulata_017796 [Turnera subulata]